VVSAAGVKAQMPDFVIDRDVLPDVVLRAGIRRILQAAWPKRTAPVQSPVAALLHGLRRAVRLPGR
jgi:hypothetical protein